MEAKGLIIFDLDNTLVDRNAIYEKAQNRLIEIIKGKKATQEDMKILREMDLFFIEKYESHGYPFQVLALSLWFYYQKNLGVKESLQESLRIFEGLTEGDEEKAVSLAEKAIEVYNSILENTIPEPFEGVKEVLCELKERGYRLVLLSESSQSMQKKTLETHGIQQYFDDTISCSRKDKQCFIDVKERWNKTCDGKELKTIVVGDGIERDVEPGNEIGAVTVWKPGGFNPGTPSPGMRQPDYSIKDIRELLITID